MQACAAKNLGSEQRKQIALDVISNDKTVTQAANDNNTSRKFIENQRAKALAGIDKTFKEQETGG